MCCGGFKGSGSGWVWNGRLEVEVGCLRGDSRGGRAGSCTTHEGRLLGLGWLSASAFTSGPASRLLRAHGRAQIVIHVILLYLSLAFHSSGSILHSLVCALDYSDFLSSLWFFFFFFSSCPLFFLALCICMNLGWAVPDQTVRGPPSRM